MSIQTAAPLLALIRKTETGRSDASAYDVMYGNHQITPKLTELTLTGAIVAGPKWTKAHKSSAAGAYQFMNDTLKDLKFTENLAGAEIMSPTFQDQLGYALLKRRGFERFMEGRLGTVEFAKSLAQEWASFPVLADTKGAHLALKRGQSYYAGDALNKALIAPDKVEAALMALRMQAPAPSAPLPDAPVPVQPAPVEPNNAHRVIVWAFGAILAAAAVIWFVFIRR